MYKKRIIIVLIFFYTLFTAQFAEHYSRLPYCIKKYFKKKITISKNV